VPHPERPFINNGAKGGVSRFPVLRNDAAAEAQKIQNGGDGFGVAEFACANPILDLTRRERANGDALVRFGMRGTGAKSARNVNYHAFAYEPRSGEEIEDFLPTSRSVAGLFKKFALRAGKRLLARLDASSDEFPQIAADGMAILPNEQQATVVENGKDNDGAVVNDEVARSTDTAWLDDNVAANVENAPVEERLTGNDFRASDNVPPVNARIIIRVKLEIRNSKSEA